MFVPTLQEQTTPTQRATWLPQATSLAITGTYAQVPHLHAHTAVVRLISGCQMQWRDWRDVLVWWC